MSQFEIVGSALLWAVLSAAPAVAQESPAARALRSQMESYYQAFNKAVVARDCGTATTLMRSMCTADFVCHAPEGHDFNLEQEVANEFNLLTNVFQSVAVSRHTFSDVKVEGAVAHVHVLVHLEATISEGALVMDGEADDIWVLKEGLWKEQSATIVRQHNTVNGKDA